MGDFNAIIFKVDDVEDEKIEKVQEPLNRHAKCGKSEQP